jgi:Flp pilus assembly protein TadD
VAWVHHSLGGLAFVTGDLEEAEAHSRTALGLHERDSGAGSAPVGRELAALAVVLDAAGRLGEAGQAHRRARVSRAGSDGGSQSWKG